MAFPQTVRPSIVSYLVSGLTMMAIAFLFCGLVSLRNAAFERWAQSMDAFRWIVFVEGTPLQIDETGAYLTKLDGVESVSFVSPESVFTRLQSSSLAPSELSDLAARFAPPSWEIKWEPNIRTTGPLLSDLVDDIKTLPAVSDVVFDERQWRETQILKQTWLTIRLLMGVTILIGIAAFSLGMGRALFFSTLRFPGWATSAFVSVNALVWWAAGFVLAGYLLGFISITALLGGFLAASIHLAFICRQRTVLEDRK